MQAVERKCSKVNEWLERQSDDNSTLVFVWGICK